MDIIFRVTVIIIMIISCGPAISGYAVEPLSFPRSVTNINATSVKFATVAKAGSTAANQTTYVTRAVNLAASGGSKIALTRYLLNPTSLAVTAAVIAAGYVWDEVSGEIITPAMPLVPTGTGCNVVFDGSTIYSGLVEQFKDGCSHNGGTISGSFPIKCSTWVVLARDDNNVYYSSTNTPAAIQSCQSMQPIPGQELDPVEITDPQADQLLQNNLTDYLKDLFTDPVTGRPYKDLPGIRDTATDIASDLDAAFDDDPETEPTTDGELDDGLDTQTEEIIDCEFMPTVCEFLAWFKEEKPLEEDPELPTKDISDMEKSWSSGLGGGSCPSPVTTSFQGQQIVYSYAGACNMAGYISPLVIGGALFASAFILLGMRSTIT